MIFVTITSWDIVYSRTTKFALVILTVLHYILIHKLYTPVKSKKADMPSTPVKSKKKRTPSILEIFKKRNKKPLPLSPASAMKGLSLDWVFDMSESKWALKIVFLVELCTSVIKIFEKKCWNFLISQDFWKGNPLWNPAKFVKIQLFFFQQNLLNCKLLKRGTAYEIE